MLRRHGHRGRLIHRRVVADLIACAHQQRRPRDRPPRNPHIRRNSVLVRADQRGWIALPGQRTNWTAAHHRLLGGKVRPNVQVRQPSLQLRNRRAILPANPPVHAQLRVHPEVVARIQIVDRLAKILVRVAIRYAAGVGNTQQEVRKIRAGTVDRHSIDDLLRGRAGKTKSPLRVRLRQDVGLLPAKVPAKLDVVPLVVPLHVVTHRVCLRAAGGERRIGQPRNAAGKAQPRRPPVRRCDVRTIRNLGIALHILAVGKEGDCLAPRPAEIVGRGHPHPLREAMVPSGIHAQVQHLRRIVKAEQVCAARPGACEIEPSIQVVLVPYHFK